MRTPVPIPRPPLRALNGGVVRREPVPRDDVQDVRRLPLPPDLKEAAIEALVRMLRAELRAPLDRPTMALYNTVAPTFSQEGRR
jgi:hypothetical protein